MPLVRPLPGKQPIYIRFPGYQILLFPQIGDAGNEFQEDYMSEEEVKLLIRLSQPQPDRIHAMTSGICKIVYFSFPTRIPPRGIINGLIDALQWFFVYNPQPACFGLQCSRAGGYGRAALVVCLILVELGYSLRQALAMLNHGLSDRFDETERDFLTRYEPSGKLRGFTSVPSSAIDAGKMVRFQERSDERQGNPGRSFNELIKNAEARNKKLKKPCDCPDCVEKRAARPDEGRTDEISTNAEDRNKSVRKPCDCPACVNEITEDLPRTEPKRDFAQRRAMSVIPEVDETQDLGMGNLEIAERGQEESSDDVDDPGVFDEAVGGCLNENEQALLDAKRGTKSKTEESKNDKQSEFFSSADEAELHDFSVFDEPVGGCLNENKQDEAELHDFSVFDEPVGGCLNENKQDEAELHDFSVFDEPVGGCLNENKQDEAELHDFSVFDEPVGGCLNENKQDEAELHDFSVFDEPVGGSLNENKQVVAEAELHDFSVFDEPVGGCLNKNEQVLAEAELHDFSVFDEPVGGCLNKNEQGLEEEDIPSRDVTYSGQPQYMGMISLKEMKKRQEEEEKNPSRDETESGQPQYMGMISLKKMKQRLLEEEIPSREVTEKTIDCLLTRFYQEIERLEQELIDKTLYISVDNMLKRRYEINDLKRAMQLKMEEILDTYEGGKLFSWHETRQAGPSRAEEQASTCAGGQPQDIGANRNVALQPAQHIAEQDEVPANDKSSVQVERFNVGEEAAHEVLQDRTNSVFKELEGYAWFVGPSLPGGRPESQASTPTGGEGDIFSSRAQHIPEQEQTPDHDMVSDQKERSNGETEAVKEMVQDKTDSKSNV